jgi:hypothetical protein
MLRVATSISLAVLLTACSPKTETASAPAPAAPAAANPYNTQIEMKELMAHVVDYAAWGIWHNQGYYYDAEGTHYLYPTTDEGWHNAESSAITLAEASNLLLLPGRPVDNDKRWVDAAHGLYNAVIKVQKAAEARDQDAFFEAGGEIYTFCTSCHAHYVIGDGK